MEGSSEKGAKYRREQGAWTPPTEPQQTTLSQHIFFFVYPSQHIFPSTIRGHG